MAVVPAFDFIRLDTKAQFSIFGVNVSWDWWVTGKKGSFPLRIPLVFTFLLRLSFRKEKMRAPGWAHNPGDVFTGLARCIEPCV